MISEIAGRISDRIKASISKALIKAVTDSNDIQLVKVPGLSGETQDGLERIQNYGMTSNPPNDSEAVVAAVGGSRDHCVVIACDSGQYRVTSLERGEVAYYSQHGQTILLKTDGSVEITAPGGVDVGSGSDSAAMAAKVNAKFEALVTSIENATTTATDGGAAFKAALVTALNMAFEAIGDVDSTNLRAD